MLPALLSNLSTNSGISTIPLQVQKCIRMTQNAEKHYTYNDYFIIKITNEQQDRVILRAVGLEGSWVPPAQHIRMFTNQEDVQDSLLRVII